MSSALQPLSSSGLALGYARTCTLAEVYGVLPYPCVSKIQEIGSRIVRYCPALHFSLGTNIVLCKTVKKFKISFPSVV